MDLSGFRPVVIGVISDTHGLLRPQALEALAGVERIIHAGDVGDGVLPVLEGVAPVHAVRGNTDRSLDLPALDLVEVGGATVLVVHDLAELDVDPGAAGVSVVVSGHTHRPHAERRNGVLYLNPGSAGPRRFHLPVTLALLEVQNGRADARILDLLPG